MLLVLMNGCMAQPVERANSETIKFSNPALGFEASLTGLLQVPAKPGKHPVVVLIHGSGQGTRYEYQNLFNELLQHGFAVFSYDKRGVNESTGSYNGVGPKNSPMIIPLLASDAYEAIEVLKKKPGINPERIILIGASQAGWIIPVVAAMSKNVSHYVILYGPTVSVGREIFYSSLAETGTQSPEQAAAAMEKYTGLEGFDPLPYFSKSRATGLWMYGGKDASIPTFKSIQILNSLPDKNFEIKLYPDAGHGLQNETYVSYFLDWLEKNVN